MLDERCPSSGRFSGLLSGTPPLTVSFTNLSPAALNWAWDFDSDGTVIARR